MKSGTTRVRWPLICAALVALSACSSGGNSTTSSAAPEATAPPSSTTTAADPLPIDAPGSLAILDNAGRVVVMNPNGSGARVVASPETAYFQPIWSPDGSIIAAGVGEVDTPGLALIDASRGTVEVVATDQPVFFAHWSSDASRVAFLSNGVGGLLDMTVYDLDTSETALFGQGSPFYFSWSPDGDGLVSHVGVDVLDVTSQDGFVESLAAPGLFQAPQWTEAGIFHLGVEGGSQQLLLTDGDSIPLGIVSGRAMFTATADGSRIALASLSEQDGVSARLQSIPILPANRLIVLDVATGDWEIVSRNPRGAFFWSPGGEHLLIIERGEVAGTLEWSVWDGTITSYGSFQPPAEFVGAFLPFFDQYAQSMTLWAPDGSAFAYPAVTDGVAGIWVQGVEAGAPVRVADGSWVSWSRD
ncbi:MAG: hypothetical protein HKN95_02965 [Acidimicrobiia bacterium]|nr:hypothetical protein [Acidimicrobiia bacterium]